MSSDRTVTLLDYGAGNVRSIRNAITKLGWSIRDVHSPADITAAHRLIFPGVGSFAAAMANLQSKGYVEPLRAYILSGRPFFGICIGMQVLFEWGEEGNCAGLGVIPGSVDRFTHALAVPHIGWNSLALLPSSADSHTRTSSNTAAHTPLFTGLPTDKYYFVHSYRALLTPQTAPYALTVTDYGERFVSSVQKGNMLATQFHPEKSGAGGLRLIQQWLEQAVEVDDQAVAKGREEVAVAEAGKEAPVSVDEEKSFAVIQTELSKRIIACLDVRENDTGDLVVTKGDQYDVREQSNGGKGDVRNLGKPVELAKAYYEQGADEITFLNITSFRAEPVADLPMLDVLKRASESVFVPLCVGGGIRDYVDAAGVRHSSLRVADEYFRSGADKISIGSDAVLAAEQWWQRGGKCDGSSSIEQISTVYGAQAVVVSIDPRRIYVQSPTATTHNTLRTKRVGPAGEEWCWYQCTVRGGREGRDVDVVQLVQAVEAMGAGELLLNCMDSDGQKAGYDIELTQHVMAHTRLPVIASSGAGRVEHFSAVFRETDVQAALAAGIFHRKEVPISSVKQHLKAEGIPVRLQ